MKPSTLLMCAVIALALICTTTTKAQTFVLTSSTIPGLQFAQSPSIAPYNGELWIAYADGNHLFITGSTNGGSTWNTPISNNTLLGGTSPAIVAWNGMLYVAWLSDGESGILIPGALYIAATANPSQVGWNIPPRLVTFTGSPSIQNSSPTLAVDWNNNLWITSVFDASVVTFTLNTSNAVSGEFGLDNWCEIDPAGTVPQNGAVMGMVAFNNRMYIGYQTQAGNGGQYLRVCSTDGMSSAGTAWTSPQPGAFQAGGGVSATVYNGWLYFGFRLNSSNDLILQATPDGTNYQHGEFSQVEISSLNEAGPSLTTFDDAIFMAYPGTNAGQASLGIGAVE